MNEYPEYRFENSDLVPVNPDKIEQEPNHDPDISALSVFLFRKKGHAETSNEETTTEIPTRLGTRPRPGKTVGKAIM
jgi:hypothetical protein